MAARSSVRLVNLLMILALFYVVSSASNQGYLFLNMSRVPKCFDVSNAGVCSGLLNYKVVDFDSKLEIIKAGLTGVNAALKTLDFFPVVSAECHESVREYACSNTFAICSDQFAATEIRVNYDVEKTEKACSQAQQSCPVEVQAITIYNCSNIMRNPMDFLECVDIPTFAGDICPKTSYKFPKPYVSLYPKIISNIKRGLPYWHEKMDPSHPECLQQFIDINCQLSRGTICSTDGKLRMYEISRQECAQTMTKCLAGVSYYQNLCDIFPDDTAQRVPLPSTDTTNQARN